MNGKEKKINPEDRYRKLKLKKGDEVIVVSGRQKGKRGKIMFIDRAKSRVYVEGVNKVKKFQRPSQENPKGTAIEVEFPMHLSNVMLYDSKKKKGVRTGYSIESGKKVRITRGDS